MDSSGNTFSAQHALGSSCVPGISGLGVGFTTVKDVVQVPDEPQFTIDQHIAAAAWVNPTTVAGDQPIVLKRLNNKTAFSLGIHNGNIEMAVTTTDGHTFISRAPISANVFTHVAGMYDGRFLFLFINGEQFGQVFAGLPVRNVFAPIRIGATTQTQSFHGVIDDVWVSTNAVSKDEVIALSCIQRPFTMAVSPATSGPVQAGTTVPYTVSVTNNDVGACRPSNYEMFIQRSFPGPGGFGGSGPIRVADAGVGRDGGSGGAGGAGGSGGPISNAGIDTVVNPPVVFNVNPGASTSFEADVTGSEDAEPGVHHIPFTVFSFGQNFMSQNGELVYELSEPTGCVVKTKRELMITSTSVVDDPTRTQQFGFFGDGGTSAPSQGVWTFGRLMRDLAPTPADAPALVEKLFQTWLTDQTVNGFTIPARTDIQRVVLGNFPRLPDGSLDLDRAPLRLQAIVNRMDLRNLAEGNAGEGRFVFGVIGPFGSVEQFTVIFEYKLPAATEADVQEWANLWHDLGSHPFPSEEYNAALEAITLRFSGRGAAPGRVNGSALSQLRTNEISLFPRWELREFVLSQTTGFLAPTTVKLTPDLGFNGSQTLADFVVQNAPAIIAEKHTVPEQFEGAPFLAGSVFNDLVVWQSPSINLSNSDARFEFSKNTCNGCHGPETNTTFLQITPRFSGQEATLSPFLTGTTVIDKFTGQSRTLNDLARRNADLRGLACGPTGGAPAPSLSKGIQRAD
jgi:hypothetical protein